MNKMMVGSAIMAGLLFSGWIYAEEGHKHGQKEASKTGAQTIQGEVLDMVCFMAHEGQGPKHKSCALKCVKEGAPMGLLTKDGKVYLLIEDHASKKPYEQMKDWAGSQATVKGDAFEKGGVQAIVVKTSEKGK